MVLKNKIENTTNVVLHNATNTRTFALEFR
jgi:hypothetical protein